MDQEEERERVLVLPLRLAQLSRPPLPCAKARASEHAPSIDDRACVRGLESACGGGDGVSRSRDYSWLSQGHRLWRMNWCLRRPKRHFVTCVFNEFSPS